MQTDMKANHSFSLRVIFVNGAVCCLSCCHNTGGCFLRA